MEEEKHLVLINPQKFASQNGTVNDIVKCIRENTTSILAYSATENLFGILCSSIQALHSRKSFLLAKIQRMNAREMDRLGICPITANIPLWNVWELEKDCHKWGAVPLAVYTKVWKEKERRLMYTAMKMSALAPAVLSCALSGFDSQEMLLCFLFICLPQICIK